MFRHILLAVTAVLAGCQSIEQLRALAPQQSDFEICRAMIASQNPNMRQAAGEEQRRRNLNCSPYLSMIQQQQNADAASIASGLQLLQMSRPQPVQMPFPQSTNCVTRYNGNTAYTSCN